MNDSILPGAKQISWGVILPMGLFISGGKVLNVVIRAYLLRYDSARTKNKDQYEYFLHFNLICCLVNIDK